MGDPSSHSEAQSEGTCNHRPWALAQQQQQSQWAVACVSGLAPLPSAPARAWTAGSSSCTCQIHDEWMMRVEPMMTSEPWSPEVRRMPWACPLTP